MQIARPVRRRRALGLTPLIDVVFLLLIFFMLATTFLETRHVQVTVPRLGGGAQGAADAITIGIAAGGAVEVNGRRVSLAELEAAVRRSLDEAPDQIVQIFPEDTVRLQRIMDVLDRLTAAGARGIALERRVPARTSGGGNGGRR